MQGYTTKGGRRASRVMADVWYRLIFGAALVLGCVLAALSGLAFLSLALMVLAATAFTRGRQVSARALTVTDAAALVEALEGITQGKLDPGEIIAETPEARRIGAAVQALAFRIRTRVDELQEAAQRDPLTGMANRAHFQLVVERCLEQPRPGLSSCLMFLDVDGFKDVNDTMGHHLGDRLLKGIADRLRIAIEPVETDDEGGSAPDVRIARFGGDEFVLFIPNLASQMPARKIANRILRIMTEPFDLDTHVAAVSVSIGMAFAPEDAASYAELLRVADLAMYHAKRSGRNRIEQFTPLLDVDVKRQVSLDRDLRDALVRGEFELHYQPQFDAQTLRICSAEALIRWRHPQRGLISPVEFIPLAEKSNLICDIGEWVIREAAATIADLDRKGLSLRIAVNVSPQQLERMEFVSLVKSALSRVDADPCLLEIEVTESLAMRDCEMAADRLGRLADLGISIAIDDFGTGYSNLASLIRLPVSRLKIDRSLLLDLTERSEVRTLVQTIISMANGLGFHTVAEGVESREQLNLLSVMGCDVAQGYLLAKPMEGPALERLLRQVSGLEGGANPYLAAPVSPAAIAC